MSVNLSVAAEMFNLPLRDLSPSAEKAVVAGREEEEEEEEDPMLRTAVVDEEGVVVKEIVDQKLSTGTLEAWSKLPLLPSTADEVDKEVLEEA